MSLKIAFVVSRIEVGGVEAFIFRLGRALALRGHSVDVVSAGTKGAWWNRVGEYGLGSYCMPEAESFSPISHAVRVCRFLRSQRYDIVLLNHCIQVAPALSFLPETVAVIPVVHNDEEWVYRVACANWKAWDVAVGVSARVTEVMRTRLPQRETRTITNGVELPHSVRSLHLEPAGELRMLFVGRLAHDQKGVLFLPQILANIRSHGINATLTIIGEGPDEKELRSRLIQFCPPGTFFVLPPQTVDAVYRSMLGHHVLLMPSFYEGLGIVALEAQACGCVPIASRIAGVTDVSIAEGKTGFLCPIGDISSFVTSAIRLGFDEMLWQQMSIAGQERIAKQFTAEVMVAKYLELFALARQGHFARKPKRNRIQVDFSIYGWRGMLPNTARRFRGLLPGVVRNSIQVSRG